MPSLVDIVVVAVVAVAVVACVRWLVRSKGGACADCASAGVCTAVNTGRCPVTDDMLARAEDAMKDEDSGRES